MHLTCSTKLILAAKIAYSQGSGPIVLPFIITYRSKCCSHSASPLFVGAALTSPTA
jgi:hypothetical protein